MPGRRVVRRLYSWASQVDALHGPLQVIRSHPRVRAIARRHVSVLLAQGRTWANVDGALRLLAEDRDQPVVFGPWRGDPALELLYWAPFVRWAQEHFSLDAERVTVISRGGVGHWYTGACATYTDTDGLSQLAGGATRFSPDPVLGLIEYYRLGVSALRPLLKRSKHVLLEPPGAGSASPDTYVLVDLAPTPAFPQSASNRRVAEELSGSLSGRGRVVAIDRSQPLAAQHALMARATGFVGAYSASALLAALSGLPVVALRSSDGELAEPDLDLATRVTSELGSSLTVVDAADAETFSSAIAGREKGPTGR